MPSYFTTMVVLGGSPKLIIITLRAVELGLKTEDLEAIEEAANDIGLSVSQTEVMQVRMLCCFEKLFIKLYPTFLFSKIPIHGEEVTPLKRVRLQV